MRSPSFEFDQRISAAPDRILVALDLPDAGYLMPYAVDQTKAYGASLKLLHAVDPAACECDSQDLKRLWIDPNKRNRDARLILGEIARDLRAEGIDCSVVVQNGDPSAVISGFIRQWSPQRIILGSRRWVNRAQHSPGSVTKGAVRQRDVPLFIVSPHARRGILPSFAGNLLHLVSVEDPESAQLAVDTAQFYRSKLRLLHLSGPDTWTASRFRRAGNCASSAAAELPMAISTAPLSKTILAAGQARPEEIAQQILQYAAAWPADLIVFGAGGVGEGTSSLKETGMVGKIAAEAVCPVLIGRHLSGNPVHNLWVEEENESALSSSLISKADRMAEEARRSLD
ncbi:MAG TPA: universal stress protein [Acidobacteriaceae bacterium]|nr:universal stress protein [Acidobacteriaceae bacterium]